MPDHHHEDALEHIDTLLQRIEGVEIATSEDFGESVEVLQDLLSSIAERALILRDRLNGEESAYTVGGS